VSRSDGRSVESMDFAEFRADVEDRNDVLGGPRIISVGSVQR